MCAVVRSVVAAIGLLTLGCFANLAANEPVAAKQPARQPASKPPRPKITISRETTYLTGPLRPDGYVDYVAALNEHASKGVTPQNNAAVLFWQAFGPAPISEWMREPFFKMLGMTQPPADGKYFVPLDDYANRKDAAMAGPAAAPGKLSDADAVEIANKQQEVAMTRPWSKDEFPVLAGWLEENEKPLALIVEGTRRTRFYAPGIGSCVIMMLGPTVQPSQEAARALCARAMLRLKDGKTEEAWHDLLVCHRLARLISQGPTVIGHMVANLLEQYAVYGDAALISHGNLPAEKASQFGSDLSVLPPMAALRDKLNVGERYNFLDCAAVMARSRPRELESVLNIPGFKMAAGILARLLASDVFADWNEPARAGNKWFDRLNYAMKNPTRAQRMANVDEVEHETSNMDARAKNPLWIVKDCLASGSLRFALSRLLTRLHGIFLPSIVAVVKADDQGAAYRGMDELLFALAAYRAEHGAYPDDLSRLCPKYVKSVPEDPCGAGPLRYKREAGGFLLYTVGANGKDDGGRNYYVDSKPDLPPDKQPKIPKDADDFCIRVPPREP